MIIISILYAFIIWYEWRYMKNKKRKKRAFQYVIGTATLLFLCLESLYYFREQWTLAEGIQFIFSPIDKIIRIEK